MKLSHREDYNNGINILKILSMFMIILLHVLNSGGAMYDTAKKLPHHYIAWFLETACLCAVNCFAIVSGFLMAGRKVRYRKIVFLWLNVEFYNIVYFIIYSLFTIPNVTLDLSSAFLPVLTTEFWYFSSYFCLFFLIPFLNVFIEKVSKRTFYGLLLTGFLLFSVGSLLSTNDCFRLCSGYSAWWMIYLYFIGAGIKKYGLFSKISKTAALSGFLGLGVFSVIMRCVMPQVLSHFNIPLLSKMLSLFNAHNVFYVSPVILLSAILLTVFCIQLKPPKILCISAGWLQPFIFQIYIIHLHPVFWDGFLENRFRAFAEAPWHLYILYIFLASAAIFLGCLLFDIIRSLIFKLLRIDNIVNWVSDKAYLRFRKSTLKMKLLEFFRSKIGI